MFEEILSSFLRSQQGEGAKAALQAQHGLSPEQADEAIGHALPVASAAMSEQTAGHEDAAKGMFGLLGGHAGSSFLMGAISGLVRGDGVGGAMQDGVVGMVSGRIAETLAAKMGLPPAQATQIAALIAPMLLHFAHEKLGENAAVQEEHGAPPAAAPGGLDFGSLLGGLLGRR